MPICKSKVKAYAWAGSAGGWTIGFVVEAKAMTGVVVRIGGITGVTGTVGNAVGTTVLVAAAGPAPTEFMALTLKEYKTPFVRPVIIVLETLPPTVAELL